jgi:hypothetical protein
MNYRVGPSVHGRGGRLNHWVGLGRVGWDWRDVRGERV